MIFEFIKYIKPTHYFNLKNNNGNFIYPIVFCDEYIDSDFQSKKAYQHYKSYASVTNGEIYSNNSKYENFEKLSVYDNYVFSRKTYSAFWIYYIFVIRILTLKNPFKELLSLIKTSHIKREKPNPFNYIGYKDFKSSLVKSEPLVSVIIPTLNRYEYLKDVLQDLEKQTYKNFEVIVVDQSLPFINSFYNQFSLNIKLIKQKEKALWKARNLAINNSNGEYLLLFDDDSRVENNWIYEHLKALDFFKADASSGVSISLIGDKVPINYSFFRISDQLDTGNVLLKKEVFKEIGLFDRQFEGMRMGDGEFGLRLFKHGYLNVSNPLAQRLHLKVGSGGLREMGSWDALRPKKLFAPRPIPSVLYFTRTYFRNRMVILLILKTIPFSLTKYANKGLAKYKLLSLIKFFLFFPLWFVSIVKSWKLSSKMIHQGSKISVYNQNEFN